MTVSQIEHADTIYADELPASDTFDRLEELLRERRGQLGAIAVNQTKLEIFLRGLVEAEAQASARRDRLVNLLTQAELRRAEIELEIVEVARLIVAEADNAELTDTL